ncbi:MAG TPA: AAA family ATPase [Patescibacteria group bacterium]|nr:AAA family ATPase [Patescibacteria group bacterium]
MKTMTTEKRVVVCTGPPGNGRDEILLKMKEMQNFHYYHMFEYIVKEARLDGTNLTKLNILDFYDSQPEKMNQYHRVAVEKITAEIDAKDGVHIVSTPLHFEWKGNRFRGLHRDEVEILNPDMFVIIFDDIIRVKKRLGKDTQWQDHFFTLGEIANWRREEVSGVYELARSFKPAREVQLVALENGPEFLKDVILSRGREKVYLSHPITGEGPDFFRNITKFGDSLKEYYIVFDPYMIKDWDIVEAWRSMVNNAIEKGEERPSKLVFSMDYREGPIKEEIDSIEIESAIKNLRFQIIDTDYKIIENSAIVVVYHPRASISAGVMCEMVYAKALAKMVYVYYPYEPSPFFEWYATRIFTEENELRDFLIKESKVTGQTPLDIYSGRPPRSP